MKEIDELTERIDGQDEIIDSLIKKITDQEKREPKTADYTLHFEALQKIFEMFLLRYNKENAELKAAIGQLNISYPAEQIQNTLSEVKTILEAVRKSLPVKVKYEFDPKSKFLIKILLGLGISVAIMLATAISLWIENNRRTDETNKFLILRGFYPDVAGFIDSAYTNNADFFIKKAKANIDEQQTMSEAAFEAKQASEESKLANDKLKKLKGKTTITTKRVK
jgi:hypothetical protein